MKKKDIYLVAGLLLAALLVFGVTKLMFNGEGNVCVVSVDNKEYLRLPLNKDNSLRIEGLRGNFCILTIKDGIADVTEASCPDKICEHHAPISKNGEAIICLPARIVVTISSEEESDVDFIV